MKSRNLSAFSAVVFAFVSVGVATAQETTWGRAEVEDYLRSASTVVQPADPFAAPATQTAPAPYIILSYPVLGQHETEDVSRPLDPRWRYDVDDQILSISADPSGHTNLIIDWVGQTPNVSIFDNGAYLHDQYLAAREVTDSVIGVGSTALGGRRQVRRRQFTEWGIAEAGGRSRGPRSGGGYGASSFVHRMPLAPEAGRLLAPHLRFEVVATSKPWATGQWSICATSRRAATFNAPTTFETEACFLNVEVQAVRFVDDRNGEVLRQWDRP